jgi:hypothetical protein
MNFGPRLESEVCSNFVLGGCFGWRFLLLQRFSVETQP